MRQSLAFLILGVTSCVFINGCGPLGIESYRSQVSERPSIAPSPASNQVAVTDLNGHPVPGAEVLFGQSAGIPFSANIGKTDSLGLASWPSGWKQELPITIQAPGFVRATFLSRTPGPHTFPLRPARSVAGISLAGKTTGFGRLVSNGVLDVSLVFAAIPRATLGSLELTALIGNGVDTVSVYGQELELPNNLSVPAQTETYFGIIPVSLDKLKYQISVPAAGTYRLAAVRAQFDFKKTVDDLRAGSSFFDIINRFQFRSYATRDLNLTLPKQTADLPSDEIKLQPKLAVMAQGLPSGYTMLATAAIESQGLCVVTDVKRLLENEKRNLMIPDISQVHLGSGVLLRSIKKYQPSRTDFSGSDFEEVSSNIATFGVGGFQSQVDSSFYPLLKPIVTTGRSLVFSPPGSLLGNAVGGERGFVEEQTNVTLSKVTLVSSGTLWLVDKTPIWDFYGPGQIGRIDIPTLDSEPWVQPGRYRWELLYSGRQSGPTTLPLGPSWNASGSHFVKTASDFQVP
ncbi:MAG: Ig-like domain-containing protein [Deltaproteobacteria bacterium]|jgi:hypothetical protein|nr:Ig-like domain-containing protein [Deltaproteobacteria bacterium]